MTKTHTQNIRIYYEDTDSGGIVYHTSYLRFCERGRTEYLRDRGFDQTVLAVDHGIYFVVRSLEAHYLKATRLDDILKVETSVEMIKKATMIMTHSIFCHNDMVFSARVKLACINDKGRAVKIPESVLNEF